MKIFHRRHLNKEHHGTISQKNIQAEKSKYEDTLEAPHERISKMAKTAGIFLKERNNHPYFYLSQKKTQEPITRK